MQSQNPMDILAELSPSVKANGHFQELRTYCEQPLKASSADHRFACFQRDTQTKMRYIEWLDAKRVEWAKKAGHDGRLIGTRDDEFDAFLAREMK